MDGGCVVSETDPITVRLAATARSLTDTIARCQAAIAVAEENMERAQLALDTAGQRLRRAQDMQTRSRECRQWVQQSKSRRNNPGQKSGPQSRESA